MCVMRVIDERKGATMKTKTIAILAALWIVPLAHAPAAWAQNQAASSTNPDRVSEADRHFVEAAAMAGSTEIDAAKLAMRRSNDEDVKSFAHHMILDHMKLAAQLKMAAPHGVEVPAHDSDEAVLDALENLKGSAFDRKYVEMVGLAGHRQAIATFAQEAAEGQNAGLKAAAEKALPTIKHHYRMAQDLAEKEGMREPSAAPQ
jgi:putative membrane protein